MTKFEAFKQEMGYRLGSFAVWAAVTFVARTARIRVVGDGPASARWNTGQGTILVTWHSRTLLPVWLYGPKGWVTIISLSRDGEYQNRIFRRFGWDVVRGSSSRGGARALVKAVRKLQAGATVTITPDGPKGPLHVVHPGALFLSQKTGAPIYPVGISAYPRWSLPTWDHYMLPSPFSRGAVVYGEPMTAPPDASPQALAELEQELARRICAAEQRAESMVVPMAGQHRNDCEP